ncbi:MAG: SDR family NAD(P)-dependent oxidoreductase [Chitinophagaceae bacterium]|nr:SDR family NAD(P)-dependent oxidoreductase [Oligoflexus sp.]
MQLSGNTILITGGGSGIGLGLALRFLENNEVILCGRDAEKLNAAKALHPRFHTIQCDVSHEEERKRLFQTVKKDFPKINVLVNNAGIQRRVDVTTDEPWAETQSELAINLEAPMHLARLFIPYFETRSHACIINVTSGLAFAPMALMPIYCASKAALHSFTLSLRHSLLAKNIEVIEIIPPAVNTDLGGKGLHDFGVPLDEFSDGIFQGLKEGRTEIAYGTSLKSSRASREEKDQIFRAMNSSSRV